MSTKIILIDDHPLVREGLRQRLELLPEFSVVGEAAAAAGALCIAEEQRPDIAVLDVDLPITCGIELTRLLLAKHPGMAVLILTMHRGEDYVARAINAGARGYVLKDAPVAQLISALQALAAGGSFFPADIAKVMKRGAPAPELSTRQREILEYLLEGYSNKEIAKLLGISVRTIESHRLVVKQKLGAERMVDLVRRAVSLGITQL
jgi:DNA-binding NarL/FixJ family response regulator